MSSHNNSSTSAANNPRQPSAAKPFAPLLVAPHGLRVDYSGFLAVISAVVGVMFRISFHDVTTPLIRLLDLAIRRYEATGWLRKMVGVVGARDLPAEPSEEEFRLGLRSGLILCNVLNKVQSGAVSKVVESPCKYALIPDGAALSTYQYFENVRNYLVAVEGLGLPSFESSDLEQGEKYSRVVNCVMALKSYRSKAPTFIVDHGGLFHFNHVIASMRRPQGRSLELARKHIVSCLSELSSMLKSSDFLVSNAFGTCDNGVEDRTTASGCQPIGFNASLNSRSSAPTPPRAIAMLSWIKAVQYFQKLLHDLDIVCSCSLNLVLEDVVRFVVKFQKFQPDLVARAHLQVLLVQEGKLFGRDPIFAVISKAAALPEIPKNHDIQNSEILVQLGQLVSSFLKILCTNAAWQRRILGKSLQDWRVIYIQMMTSDSRDYLQKDASLGNTRFEP